MRMRRRADGEDSTMTVYIPKGFLNFTKFGFGLFSSAYRIILGG